VDCINDKEYLSEERNWYFLILMCFLKNKSHQNVSTELVLTSMYCAQPSIKLVPPL